MVLLSKASHNSAGAAGGGNERGMRQTDADRGKRTGERHMSVIGFIGLGNMGGPMAANLVRHGHAVRGFDLSAQCSAAASAAGVEVVANPAEAAAGAEAVITMLPGGTHVLEVYRSLIAAAGPGTLLIDSSTIDVESARQAHRLAEASGLPSLDAPVSGGTGGAASGTLTFMAGGTEGAFARARAHPGGDGPPDRVLRRSRCGTGGEDLQQHDPGHFDDRCVGKRSCWRRSWAFRAQALFDVAATSSGQCWSLTSYCPVPGPVPTSPANHGYKPGFAAALMLKDLRLAQQAADGAGVLQRWPARSRNLRRVRRCGRGRNGLFRNNRGNSQRKPRMSAYETILTEADGRVALITLDRPKALNALNWQSMREIVAAVDAFDRDPAIGCIVITGSEKAFAAGRTSEMQSRQYSEMYSSRCLRRLGRYGTRTHAPDRRGFGFRAWRRLRACDDVRHHTGVRNGEIRTARDQARYHARHGRHAAAGACGGEGEGNGIVPDWPDHGCN